MTPRDYLRQLRVEYRRERGRHDRWSDGTPGRGAQRRALREAMDGSLRALRRSLGWNIWGAPWDDKPVRYLGPGKGYEYE